MTTQTITPTNGQGHVPHRPATDAEAVRANLEALQHIMSRAEEIRQAPSLHKPHLVTSDHVRGPRAAAAHSARTGQGAADLDNFASKDVPGTQREIQDCVNKILTAVGSPAAAPKASAAESTVAQDAAGDGTAAISAQG